MDQEFSKKEIFHQIHTDLMSSDRPEPIFQKTKSNYKFVVFLDVLALCVALFGGIVVYFIFKEQQIQLVEGTKAVQILELSLIQQFQKKKEQEFLAKDKELQEALVTLDSIQLEFDKEIDAIRKQAAEELERQRLALEQEYQNKLEGKKPEEQLEIRQEYENELDRINQDSKNLVDQRIQNIQQQHQEDQLKQQQQLEQLRSQLDQAQQKVSDSQQELQEVQSITPEVQVVKNIIDLEIARLFLQIQEQLKQQKFTEVSISLQAIEAQIKRNSNSVKQRADRFLTGIINEYITLQNISSQDEQGMQLLLDQLTNDINGLRTQITVIQASNQLILAENKKLTEHKPKILDSGDFYQRLQNSISLLTKAFADKEDVSNQLRKVRENDKEIIDLLSSQSNYFIANDTDAAKNLFIEAETLFKVRRYKDSGEIYQKILRLYPNTKQIDKAIEGLYQSIEKALGNENAMIIDRLSPELQINAGNEKSSFEIVYLSMPSGYVTDILEDGIVLMLTPASQLKQRNKAIVFRMMDLNQLQLSKVTEVSIDSIDGRYAIVKGKFPDIRLGDLIYENVNK